MKCTWGQNAFTFKLVLLSVDRRENWGENFHCNEACSVHAQTGAERMHRNQSVNSL